MMPQHRILLADDDEIFRETTASFLRRLGYECVTAPEASTVLSLMRESNFDLLISDIEMPGNANLELVKQVSELAYGFPVILLTGHPTVESAVESVRLPVVAYLMKPSSPEELEKLVRESIERYSSFRTISLNRERLEKWSRDLGKLEEMMQAASGDLALGAASEYMSITFQNLLLTLVDLKKMMEAMARKEGKEEAITQVALIEGLRETIQVLAESRRSFKSKELGDLRKKLETMLKSQ